jgi:hypothetical protein
VLIFAIVVTIGPNHNNFFLPNLSAKYPAGVFTHNLAAANALRMLPICAPERCNSDVAKDGIVGARIPCPMAHANESPHMDRISLLSLRKFGIGFVEVGAGVTGAVVGIWGESVPPPLAAPFFFVFRPLVGAFFVSSEEEEIEENEDELQS